MSEKEFQESEIPDGRSPEGECEAGGNEEKPATAMSEKEFQESEIPDAVYCLNNIRKHLTC